MGESGKEVLSPAPPPLETARAPFDACSLSLTNALRRTRCFRPKRTHLHDTDPGPLPGARGDRTSKPCGRRQLLCLPQWLTGLPRAARPQGSRLPLGRDDVPTPLRALTARPSLAPSSFTRCRLSTSCEGPTQWDGDGLPTFRRCTKRGLGLASPPEERRLRAVSSEHHHWSPCPLGPGRTASLACHP